MNSINFRRSVASSHATSDFVSVPKAGSDLGGAVTGWAGAMPVVAVPGAEAVGLPQWGQYSSLPDSTYLQLLHSCLVSSFVPHLKQKLDPGEFSALHLLQTNVFIC